ncbi:glutamyl-Q tRNA(Asp) synthetase [Arcanobacterium ihumii]|uniref:glutamyl-Q tRNA(Asp) synthetase n=1 Tax=Arcanobacterium ihumii TaxID=2138162 RepID=UPI000F5261A9|nr:glutamyl-Q tRNA(Asp) synthetase [Arcanobacterium ihumii]
MDASSEPVLSLGFGRYAPSPSGILHIGNLRTALLAWAFARSSGRGFQLRIEDLDGRSRPEFETAQLRDLEELGIDWDGEVIRQSQRLETYATIVEALQNVGQTFECYCSRKDLAQAASAPHTEPGFYPGTCRNINEAERDERCQRLQGRVPAIRLKSDLTLIEFTDKNFGNHTGAVDDIVLRRGDGVYSYNFVAVVDDLLGYNSDPTQFIAQLNDSTNRRRIPSVTQIVRGNDLLASTPRQIYLQRVLGFDAPEYAHVPLVLNPDGVRLAKRDGAVTLPRLRELGVSTADVVEMMALSLGMEPVRSASEFLGVFNPNKLNLEPWIFDSDQFE